MAKRTGTGYYTPTTKQARTETIATTDGGRITMTQDGKGGFAGTITRGYKETPEERQARQAGPRASRIEARKGHQPKGGRRGGKQALRREVY